MAVRIPFLMKERGSNRRLTLLSCGVCGSIGHFAITRIGDGRFVCPRCWQAMAAANPSTSPTRLLGGASVPEAYR